MLRNSAQKMVLQQLLGLKDVIWSPTFWFGKTNITWDDFEDVNTSTYELLYPIPIAILLLVSRTMVVGSVYEKFGPSMGMKNSPRRKSCTNETLETVYQSTKNPDKNEIIKTAVKSGMSQRQAERWLRKRSKTDSPTKSEKLIETTWRAIYYLGMWIYGSYILFQKQWVWDTRYCWYGYPHHRVEDETRRYYMVQLTFYWFLTCSQINGDSGKRRKDFWQMLLHHIATISLINFSWVLNMVRAGMLVLVLHDSADVLLEIAKVCKYANLQKACNSVFALFVLTWIVTRLYIYPKYVVYTTVFESAEIVGLAPVYYVMNAFMVFLLVLHVIWTYYIIKALEKALKQDGNIEKDERSSSDSD